MPRLISDGPKYEGGEARQVELRPRRFGGSIIEVVHEGQPLVRARAGSPVALWNVPGLPGIHRKRKGAMIERRKALRAQS